ncbi:uncharacterized protein LOC106460276 isoform X1 [Limulus polyphemus]|uniref:Uncharacterized protein LOC106460276 isoform X1 n=1 Tax=Limulus polyphemus TaxID=6850 RepID=A0ABM1SGA4_LIMPO|nr:uncharacterized protein LOC106460276 isoform X1 [Limulus polyphemus]
MGRVGLNRIISVFLVVGLMVVPNNAAKELCYSPGGVAGIVIATFIVTMILCGLVLVAAWYLWKRKKVGGLNTQHLGTQATKPGGASKYAFDNPYFGQDDVEGSTRGTVQDQTSTGLVSDRGHNTKDSLVLKRRISKSNQFPGIPLQPRAVDDTCVGLELERILVPLRGYDFTGLGFNICGNMRDGIFVKDVLNRGPANESGKIKAGDRILKVIVSFSSIVYEDALTILSYASPYDVQLEIEKTSEGTQPIAGAGRRLTSSSFNSGGQILFHPLYRSQSIDDLTQIGKDSVLSHPTGQLTMRNNSKFICRARDFLEQEKESSLTIPTGSLNERMLTNATGKDDNLPKQLSTRSYQRSKRSLFLNEEGIDPTRRSLRMSQSELRKQESTVDLAKTKSSLSSESKMSLSSASISANDNLPDHDKNRQQYITNKIRSDESDILRNRKVQTTAHVHQIMTQSRNQPENSYSDDQISTTNKVGSVCFKGSALQSTDQHSDVYSSLTADNSEMSSKNYLETADKQLYFKSSSLGDLTEIKKPLSQPPIVFERAISLDLNQEELTNSDLQHQTKMLENCILIPSEYENNVNPESSLCTDFSQRLSTLDCTDKTMGSSYMQCPSVSETTEQTHFIQTVSILSKHQSLCKSPEFQENFVDRTCQENKESNNVTNTKMPRTVVDATRSTFISSSFKDGHEYIMSGVISNNTAKESTMEKGHSYDDELLLNPTQFNHSSDKKDEISRVLQPKLVQQSEHGGKIWEPLLLDSPVLPPLGQDTSVSPRVPSPAPFTQEKEVIEISKDELDSVMISHREFLLKQVKKTGLCSNLNWKPTHETTKDIEFEPWIVTDINHNYNERTTENSENSKIRQKKL